MRTDQKARRQDEKKKRLKVLFLFMFDGVPIIYKKSDLTMETAWPIPCSIP